MPWGVFCMNGTPFYPGIEYQLKVPGANCLTPLAPPGSFASICESRQFPFISQSVCPGCILPCSDVLQDVCSKPKVYYVLMHGKMPSHCGAGLFEHMTLESISDPICSLSNISETAPVEFQAINEITALACAMRHDIINLIAV